MELYGTEDKKCPCSKGIFQIEKYSDDWNRYETRWVMMCPFCKVNYVLWSYVIYEKGIGFKNYLWIPKELNQKIKKIQFAILKKKKMLIRFAKKQYLDEWLQYIQNFKSKRAAWEDLRRSNINFPSLSTFYKHYKTFWN